ncbi:hypothetical protein ACIBH1_48735 [Nonomuraea sp. NPDC050663]|uniref:hypothetical protein n=1 Tax=Nonomuraea sp. NPDC050663 TaxID=3364370 RepID=UPI0037B1F4A8
MPKTADGIAGALSPTRRMDFYRELGTAQLEQAEAVLRRWWCEAMLDTDPDADRIYQSAIGGNLRKATLAEVEASRAAKGSPVE